MCRLCIQQKSLFNWKVSVLLHGIRMEQHCDICDYNLVTSLTHSGLELQGLLTSSGLFEEARTRSKNSLKNITVKFIDHQVCTFALVD